MQIKNILATKGMKVVTIAPEQTLREVVAKLAEHKIGALVVADNQDRPVGIISERDIIRIASQDAKFQLLPVTSAMTAKVITGSPEDDVRSVQKTMTERGFRHLPVVEAGKLAGIVSIRDIVKAMLDEYEGEIDTLHIGSKG